MTKRVTLAGLLMFVCGCAHYQIEVSGNTVWRLDKRTGALEACGFQQDKPTCTAFPAPK